MNAKVDIFDVVIKTKRLTLRRFLHTDLDDLFEYASVKGVGENAGWLPHKNKEESQKILDMFINERKVFAIVFNNKVIGSLGIEEYNEKFLTELKDLRVREIGYVLSKDYWGKGLMPEAVKAVIKYLFEELDLDVITCGYFEFNKQSSRVQEKCGFFPYSRQEFKTNYGETFDGVINLFINPTKDVDFEPIHRNI